MARCLRSSLTCGSNTRAAAAAEKNRRRRSSSSSSNNNNNKNKKKKKHSDSLLPHPYPKTINGRRRLAAKLRLRTLIPHRWLYVRGSRAQAFQEDVRAEE